MSEKRNVHIIGAGLAGLSASMTLAQQGRRCSLISVQHSERAQSVLAEGGINAVLDTMGENDTIAEHFADTMKGGVYLADPNAVDGLTRHAPQIVAMLRGLGVPFHMDGDRMVQRNFGGQKKKRTAYAKSSTGKALMTALIDEVRKYERQEIVRRYPHHRFVRLLISNGACIGCEIEDTHTGERQRLSGTILLASGGMNGMFGDHTTGTTANTGDVTATVFSQGLALGNPEFIQYHPTTMAITGKRMLVSEAARGEGGRLYVERDGKPYYFMEERYPQLGNLMPRDVVSREIEHILRDTGCGDQVYLDMRALSADTWEQKLSDLREECIHYRSIDPAKEPLPVEPGIHYCMGGIYVDQGHRTSLPGVYAAGECACQYHGANRLGGNSLLGAIYGGRTAAESILTERSDAGADAAGNASSSALRPGAVEAEDMPPEGQRSDNTGVSESMTAEGRQISENEEYGVEKQMEDALLAGLGILRDETGMQAGADVIDGLLQQEELSERMRRRLLLAKAMLLAAKNRKESRGAHYRTDFPDTEEAYRRISVVTYTDGKLQVGLREIPADVFGRR